MSDLIIYTVFDKQSETFSVPFCANSDFTAFRNTITQLLSIPREFWSDFSVYSIGSFSLETGVIEFPSNLVDLRDGEFIEPHLIASGYDLIKFFESNYIKESK